MIQERVSDRAKAPQSGTALRGRAAGLASGVGQEVSPQGCGPGALLSAHLKNYQVLLAERLQGGKILPA